MIKRKYVRNCPKNTGHRKPVQVNYQIGIRTSKSARRHKSNKNNLFLD